MEGNSSGVGGPGTSIANCHINASEYGIYSNLHGGMAITGNTFETLGGASTNYGIIFDGTMSKNIIANNQTNGMTTGIVLNAGVTSTVVTGNLNVAAGTAIANAGIGNFGANNY
jgi:hypothetical protein